MLYLYALADPDAQLPDFAGIQGEQLRVLSCDSVAVIAGDISRRPEITSANLRAQDRVVRALHDHLDALLPMRFGAFFASDSDVGRAIDTHLVGLRERLETVRRRDQMTSRVLRGSPPPAAITVSAEERLSGADYLRRRARPVEIAPLLHSLTSIVHATRIERGRTDAVVATVYHLIERGQSDEYRTSVDTAARDLPSLKVHVSGPSPCYAFASAI
jgi:hypothetical protein